MDILGILGYAGIVFLAIIGTRKAGNWADQVLQKHYPRKD